MQELCAIRHLDQRQWWAFLHCLNFNGRDKVGDPDTALKCADTAKFDWMDSGVGACAGEDGSGLGEEGVLLLQQSVQTSQELGIECVISLAIPSRLIKVSTAGKAALLSLMESLYVSTMARGKNAGYVS